jgi:exodeoxyribonuclease-3
MNSGSATLLAGARYISVMTWNVQAASNQRALRQALWLEEHAWADAVVLTEVPPSGRGHLEALEAVGFRCLVEQRSGDRRVLLGSRVGVLEPTAPVATGWPHRVMSAELQGLGRPLRLTGVYVPSRGPAQRRNVAKRAVQQAVSDALPVMSAAGIDMIVGDLNVVEPDHQPHYGVFADWEYDFYRSFESHGFLDAYRSLHPSRVEHSWFGHSGNGYRFDHAFVSRESPWHVVKCWYDQTGRDGGLSDHAALVTQLAC